MKTKAAFLAVCGSLAIALAAAAGGSARPAATHPNLKGQSVKILTTEGALDTVVFYHAVDLLKQWGAHVQITEAGSTSTAVAGAVSGQADIVDVSPLAGLGAVANGLNMKIFAVSGPRTDDVFVSKPSITSMQQMKGATVGVLSINSVNGIEVGLALAQAQLKIPDVQVVAAGGQSVRVGALIGGRLDGGPIAYDNYRDALKSQGFHILYNYMTQAPGLVHDVLWASPSWISSHQTLAVAFNRALLQSFRWFANPKNKAAFVQLATSSLQGVDAGQASSTYDDYAKYHFYPPNDILTKATMTGNESQFKTYNLLSKSLPIDQWVDTTYAQKALALEGRVKQVTAKKKH